MKTTKLLAVLLLLSTVNARLSSCFAQGTWFTYQGRLSDHGNPANGYYDMLFRVYNDLGVGQQISFTLQIAPQPVSNGLFSAALTFGEGVFDGSPRWLEISVRTNGSNGNYTTLTPRQQLTPTPYAIMAGTAGTVSAGAISNAHIASGQVVKSLNGMKDNVVLAAGANVSLVTNGNTLSVNASGSGVFSLIGNNAYYTNGNVGIGRLPTTNRLEVSGDVSLNGFLKLGGNRTVISGFDGGSNHWFGPSPDSDLAFGINRKGTNNYDFSFNGNLTYGKLTKLDVADNFAATVRAGDFLFGHSTRRGTPGRALVDVGDALAINFATDWTNTILGGKVGIGTGDPQTALHVNGTVTATQFNGAGLTGIAGGSIADGAVSSAKIADGTIAAADVNVASFDTTFWRTAGNAGTTAGTHFIGTTDNQPLELRVNNLRALRLEPSVEDANHSGAPNVVGGSPKNFVAAGIMGATIAGGGAIKYFGVAYTNAVSVHFGTISGGYGNTIQPDAYFSTIGGGGVNTIWPDAYYSFIGGGVRNTIQTNAGYSTIGGGDQNKIQSWADHSTIGGGYQNTIQNSAHGSTIGGGEFNTNNAALSTIGGGYVNIIQAAGYSTIGGGERNTIQVNANDSTIGGGHLNSIEVNASNSTIGGGYNNTIQPDAHFSTIGGGYQNTNSGDYAAVGGGYQNTIQTNAFYSTIGGGGYNEIQPYASYSTIGGGAANTVAFGAWYATVPGGYNNTATGFAFAAGTRARANHTGAFVWADSNNSDFASSTENEVSFRCAGGVRFTSGSGSANQTVSWVPSSASWSFTSDRNTKTNLQPVDTRAALERVSQLSLHEWNYVGYAQRHVGPMAQDFHQAFPWSGDDRTLNSADLDGVALAAIQGLNQKLEEKLEQKQTEITELKQRLEALEAIVHTLKQTEKLP